MNQISIPDNYNYFNEKNIHFNDPDISLWSDIILFKKNTKSEKELQKLGNFELTSDILNSIQIHSFKKNKDKTFQEKKLILSVNSDSEKISFKTGNYAGIIFYKGFKFEIHSRFGNFFLQRMLNFLNNIYID